LTILDRGDHGWMEFVTAHGCDSEDQVRRFYERQGGYLALLYALEATDFHHENLLAAGEHPVLLDLEALFHPRVGGEDLKQGDELAGSTLNCSVLRTGLLPQRVWSNAERGGIDLSGLGAPGGQLTPFSVPQMENVGTDEMRLRRKHLVMPEAENRPSLQGRDVNVLDHAGAIVAGFTGVYRLFLAHRDDLLAEGGPLARFARDEVRVIVRATQTYATLLHESFHPDLLRDALDRDRCLDHLWVQVEYLPHLARLLPAERADLLEGDMPLFTTRPDCRDLWSSAKTRIADFFDETGMDLVRRRVRQLDDGDLTKQLWIIRASLATLRTDTDSPEGPGYELTEPRTVADPERLLAAARAAGDRLEELALRGAHDVSWVGLTLAPDRRWSLTPLGPDLYDGLSGVVLFLAYLGDVTGEQRYTALARAALATLRRQVERSRSSPNPVGAFSGWGGVIHCLTHLAALWHDAALLHEATAVVELLPDLIARDEQVDVISGSAGCLGALLGLYQRAPAAATLAAAVQCGDRLLARAQPQAQGVGWLSPVASKPLAGFSHGAAGIAWALLELAALTSAERFRTTALAGIAYERSLFSAQAENWHDLRDPETAGRLRDDSREQFMTAWCHGAPGIGLARLRSLAHLDDGATRAEIDAALRTTLAQGFGGGHCLCHGDLGNLELFLQARETLGDARLASWLGRGAAGVLESIERHGWRCGVPLGVESPGLMTGLAGIGYGLLRLAEPARVPSVLTLEPPR
jgi:type 2 lantibiotic biosynthesis protein LanM